MGTKTEGQAHLRLALLWVRQFGSADEEFPRGVGVDAAGNVYVGGSISVTIEGIPIDNSDMFLAKYDSEHSSSSSAPLQQRRAVRGGTSSGRHLAAFRLVARARHSHRANRLLHTAAESGGCLPVRCPAGPP
ncbi:MAG: hypothetical protein E6J63_13350 [Deltaproteobacteria bacterium]|nr:MAG: hypothetical protein E6J63_13350 [Deltaproteobacteria bacterium]